MHDGYVFFGCSDWLKLKGRKQPTPSIRVVSIHEVDVTSTIFIKRIPNANPYPNPNPNPNQKKNPNHKSKHKTKPNPNENNIPNSEKRRKVKDKKKKSEE